MVVRAFLAILLLALSCLSASVVQAAPFSASLYSGLHWRLIGPFRGGRVTAVAGVPSEPRRFYFGAVDGGVWETDDAGRTWLPIFDQEPVGSIGAIAVAPSNPQVIYVGSGEADMRSSIGYGNGMYKSTDGGRTWRHIGLVDTQHIGSILVDPRNPNVVYVAALGHAYAANSERGVFKSTDGGKTWEKVLYKNADTGAIDLAFGGNSQTLFAALWQTRRPPWSVYPPSNGPGSGLYKSTDGGQTWTQITGHGFPGAGVGRIGVTVSPSDPQIVYANVDAKAGEGGLYRSDDGGSHWKHVSSDRRIWSRWWYFGDVTVDPKNPDTVYICDTTLYKSTDGGKTFVPFQGTPGGDDYQRLWINPQNTSYMVLGMDQGTVVSMNGGRTWSSRYNQPTGQFYHVVTDNQFFYGVYGAQQDSGAIRVPSRTDFLNGITHRDFQPIIAGAESNYIAPDPLHPRYIYGSSFNDAMVKYDTLTAQDQFLDPTRAYPGISYRSTWTLPAVFSPIDPHVLYYSNQMLFRTDDGGQHWSVISPDLSRKDPGVPSNLDPVTAQDTTVNGPRRGVIYTIAPSPLKKGVIWVGTDDGLVWLTRDEGKHWKNVTPKALTPWSKVGMIEASDFDVNTAYAAVDRHRLDDYKPYIYVTHDGGKSWKLMVKGIAMGDFVNVVRDDPAKRGLLYAGTEKHVYVSFDDGQNWQSLQLNLPVTSMRDIDVHGDDLVLATFGRGFWILDDIAVLRQLNTTVPLKPATLFKPAPAYRVRRANLSFYGMQVPKDEPQAQNPPFGAILDYYLKSPVKAVTMEILDGEGQVVRRYSSTNESLQPNLQKLRITPDWIIPAPRLSTQKGMHRFVWDLHYALPEELVRKSTGEDENYSRDGVWAPPGQYTVKLVVDGQTYSQPLEIREDPRVNVSQVALERQYKLARHIETQRVAIANAINGISSLLSQLRALKSRASGQLAQRVRNILEHGVTIAGLNPAASSNSSVGVPSGDFTSLHYLAGAFAKLEATVESADAAPTPDTVRGLSKLTHRLNRTIAQWRNLENKVIPQFNRQLRSAGLEKIAVQ